MRVSLKSDDSSSSKHPVRKRLVLGSFCEHAGCMLLLHPTPEAMVLLPADEVLYAHTSHAIKVLL